MKSIQANSGVRTVVSSCLAIWHILVRSRHAKHNISHLSENVRDAIFSSRTTSCLCCCHLLTRTTSKNFRSRDSHFHLLRILLWWQELTKSWQIDQELTRVDQQGGKSDGHLSRLPLLTCPWPWHYMWGLHWENTYKSACTLTHTPHTYTRSHTHTITHTHTHAHTYAHTHCFKNLEKKIQNKQKLLCLIYLCAGTQIYIATFENTVDKI